jgi:response regulator RpfG family c-di-GMP phosphodiesterase
MAKKVILCVDDESIILRSLKSELVDLFGYEYIVETAESGDEALEVFLEYHSEGCEIPVVIIDYIMPGMKGDELAKRIHDMSSITQKIILSGQATIEGVTNAINNANLFKYIEKPWGREELRKSIVDAVRIHDENRKMMLQNIELNKIKNMLEKKIKDKTLQIEELQKKLDAGDTAFIFNRLFENIQYEIEEIYKYTPNIDGNDTSSELKIDNFIEDFVNQLKQILPKNKG